MQTAAASGIALSINSLRAFLMEFILLFSLRGTY